MEEMRSKVYIKVDEQGRILRCEGGYSIGNIDNIDKWIFVDEGTGDRYNMCQSQYFDGGLYTEDGICRYKCVKGKCKPRTTAELEADRAAQKPTPQAPTEAEQLRADADYCLMMLEG